METGRLVLQTPLGWHGRLRDEPSHWPWGYGYEIELSSVAYRGESLAVRGGMRLGFAPRDGEQAVPDLYTGDEVTAVAHAKRLQVYKDDGAFDRCAYLEQQNIYLLATLRVAELLERVGSQPLTLDSVLPHARHILRGGNSTLYFSKRRKLRGFCVPCFWEIAVSWIAMKPRTFRRPDSSMCSARALRTDRDGAVRILTDGTRIEVTCFVACPELDESSSRQPQTPNHQQR